MAGRWRDGIQSGLRSAQPAFGSVAIGTLYFVTDEGVLERSTGAAWVEVAINETAHDALDHTGLTGVGGGSATFVGCRVYHSTTQSVQSGSTPDAMLFDSEEYDTDTIHDPSTNTSRLTIPTGKGGKWRFTAGTIFASNTTGVRGVMCRVDGTPVQRGMQRHSPSGGASVVQATWTLALTAGQYVEFLAYQNAGVNLNIGHASSPEFQSVAEAIYLGA